MGKLVMTVIKLNGNMALSEPLQDELQRIMKAKRQGCSGCGHEYARWLRDRAGWGNWWNCWAVCCQG
jgi:hypothetical protein